MRARNLTAILMGALALLAVTTSGYAQSVATLMQRCEIYEKDAKVTSDQTEYRKTETALCLGYFMAIRGMSLAVEADGRPFMRACTPKGATADQFIRIFLKFARANPEKLHEDAMFNVWNSLIAAFPCPKT